MKKMQYWIVKKYYRIKQEMRKTMLAGDAAPPVIDSVHVTTCSICGGTMHNKQRCRIAHDGFGNAMLVADMDKAISKGHLIVEINYTTTTNPLPCSMADYNKMREDSKFSTLAFVAVCKCYLNNSTISLENVSQVDNDSGMFDMFNEEDNNNAIKEDDCNSNFITQETLDDLLVTQEMFQFEKIERLTLFTKNPQVLL